MDPSVKSSDRAAVEAQWDRVAHILAGADAVRAAKTRFLPKFHEESNKEYDLRLASAPWRPEFVDALNALASKPFSKPVSVEGQDETLQTIIDDVDMQGNNLHVFASEIFLSALAYGCAFVLVDYPRTEGLRTVEDEKKAGVRPYFVRINPTDILSLRTEMRNGREVVTHFRYMTRAVREDNFQEAVVETVRVYEPGRFQEWTKVKDKWEPGEVLAITLDEVPLARFYAGTRVGGLARPPLNDLAVMQFELYRALSREDEILTYAGCPMLAAVGFSKPSEPVRVGPKTILFAPPGQSQTDWKYIQPDASNIVEVRAKVASIIEDMRRLGMQPLTARSGTMTATASSIEGAKAHSVLQKWSLMFGDTLNQAFVYVTKWMKRDPSVSVTINTDFGVMPYADAPIRALMDMRKTGDLSQASYWSAMKRFGVLPEAFDDEGEVVALATEQEGLEPEDEPAIGADALTRGRTA